MLLIHWKLSLLEKKNPMPYWANASSNSLAGNLIREADASVKEEFEVLLKEGVIQTFLDEQVVFQQMEEEASIEDTVQVALAQLEEKK
ncbi:MAG: hypothetical protein OSJ52_07945 [Lachnospiraceae bacterium]|nr:hypothetical protein [Lachnospiraceae bacterium]